MTTATDLQIIRSVITKLIGLSYDTGYYAGKAESGQEIDRQVQRQTIEARNHIEISLFRLITTTVEDATKEAQP